MRNQSLSGKPILHRVLTIAAATFLFCMPAMAQSHPEQAAVPILKGGYVVTDIDNCVAALGTFFQLTGSFTFNPEDGTAKVDVYSAGGDPLTLNHTKGHESYSNSEATLTIGTKTYRATYGKLEKGVATYLAFIAVNSDGCAEQGSLSRQ